MDVQVRTDYHVNGDEGLIAHVRSEVTDGLEPFARRITSVQVHLSEESGARKGPPVLRCVLEVRPTGHAPVVVTRKGTTKDVLLRGAIGDMRKALERTFGRIDAPHIGGDTIRRPASPRR
jgi:hypothetical protein